MMGVEAGGIAPPSNRFDTRTSTSLVRRIHSPQVAPTNLVHLKLTDRTLVCAYRCSTDGSPP